MPVLRARVAGAWVDVVGGTSGTVDRWNTAWGTVAYAQSTTGQTGIGSTQTDVPGLSVTFTPVVGRRYVTTASWLGIQGGGSIGAIIPQLVDGSNTTLMQRNTTYDTGRYLHLYIQVVESGLPAVATTRKARVGTTSGTTDVVAGAGLPSFIEVRDVGPVSGSTAIPSPTPAWINLTLINGFTNAGGGQAAQYRKVGDIVYMRGWLLAPASSGGKAICAALPADCRIPASMEMGVAAWNGSARIVAAITAGTAGDLVLNDTVPSGGSFSIGQLFYSVTA